MNVGYVGSGPISDFHIPALKNNGLNIEALGTTKNSESSWGICKKYGLTHKYCKGGWEEVLDSDVDAYIICIKIENTLEVLDKILEKGKPVFVEKPINFSLKELEKIKNNRFVENIFVGYNRRYYKTCMDLKKLCNNSSGGTVLVNIPDSCYGIKQFISNGCHMVDLVRYLLGDFEIVNKIIKTNSQKNDMDYFSALCRNKKWTIIFNAHSLIPSNFSVSINSDKNVFELKPIEKLTIYEGMKIIEPTNEDPLRKYVPKVKYSFSENCCYKPGFDLMYKNFRLFIQDSSYNYCTFHDAYETLKCCLEFIDSEVSRDFKI
ncbi:Gfo/Idh/MocA family oxidoreductase [Acinetobacter sp.]|uniref:Gfo/Idh/MocA family oxidoreductase n=1 Tax=Acinetobacter sp. TaxID=472 RepID=UPI000C41C1E0|nr:Gfo/Idh/MocA family oxidoreductase [Acinetobacter sp.]MBC69489.1 hypothetical protein [Acinetobacter sp.]